MNWLGAKPRFKKQYKKIIQDIVSTSNQPWRFVDAFCGSGAVAEVASTVEGISNIHVNDQYHRAVGAALARIYPFQLTALDFAKNILDASHSVINLKHWARFVMEYSVPVGKRKFFTPENARAIARGAEIIHGIFDQCEQKPATEKLRLAVMALFADGVDRISNTTGQYAAYLKRYKKAALQPFTWNIDLLLKPKNHQLLVTHSSVDIFNIRDTGSRLWMQDEPTLLYLDPPYTSRSYNGLYNIPEILTRGNPALLNNLKGDAGIPEPPFFTPSPFSSKRRALDAFEHVAELAELTRTRAIMISYSDQGIVPLDKIKAAFEAHQFKGGFETIPNTRPYKSHHGGDQTKTIDEYVGVFHTTRK